MACKVVGKLCKRADENLPIGIDLTGFCERRWLARKVIAEDETLRPSLLKQTGYEYVCTVAGQCGVNEPVWARTIGGTVTDGSVTWTCQAIGNDSLARTITECTWVTDDFDVTDEDLVNTEGEQQVSCFIGGSPGRGRYQVVAHVTFGVHEEDFAIEVTV